MIEDIKNVIEELEKKYTENRNYDEYEIGYDDALIYSTSLLQQVVNKHETNHTYHSNGSGTDDTEGKMEG